MKKVLITIFQLSVTAGVLYWVYHDPNRRAQMVEALRNAEYRWVLMAMLAYLVVEVAAAFRWHVLLKVQNIHSVSPADWTVFYRVVLQPIPPRRHRRRHHQELLPVEGNA